MVSAEVLAARAKMTQKFGDQSKSKGAMRRKKKTTRVTAANDKQFDTLVKKHRLQEFPVVAQADLYLENGDIMRFSKPKVHFSQQSNCTVLTGKWQQAQQSAEDMQNMVQSMMAGMKGAGVEAGDMPDLVENFDDVSEEAD